MTDLFKALAIEVCKDLDVEEVEEYAISSGSVANSYYNMYKLAEGELTKTLRNQGYEEVREEYEERYYYIFESYGGKSS